MYANMIASSNIRLERKCLKFVQTKVLLWIKIKLKLLDIVDCLEMKIKRIYKHKVQKSWTKDMVSNILKNEVYTGTLITHKKQSINIRGKDCKIT